MYVGAADRAPDHMLHVFVQSLLVANLGLVDPSRDLVPLTCTDAMPRPGSYPFVGFG